MTDFVADPNAALEANGHPNLTPAEEKEFSRLVEAIAPRLLQGLATEEEQARALAVITSHIAGELAGVVPVADRAGFAGELLLVSAEELAARLVKYQRAITPRELASITSAVSKRLSALLKLALLSRPGSLIAAREITATAIAIVLGAPPLDPRLN